MSKSANLLERGGMYLLVMMPFYGTVTQFFVKEPLVCFLALAAVVFIGTFVSALPRYVGSYSETEVIRYEGGVNRGADPNPDRESRHETVSEGHRFPLRLPACAVTAALTLLLLLLLPEDMFTPGSGIYRFGFIALTVAFEVGCMGSLVTGYCLWTELPGIAIGFFGYLIAALYLHFSDSVNSSFQWGLGVCALLFLFGGFVCLNRASLSSQSGEGEKRGVPKALEKRNRRVVIIFAAIISVISFVKPVRDAALWVLRWIGVFFRWLAWVLRGGKEAEKGDLNRILAMQGFGEEQELLPEELEELQEEVEPLESTVFDKIFVYLFIAFLVFGILFIIYYHAMKKHGRDGFFFRRRKKVASEGYYDEKESIDGSEIRKKYSRKLRDRFKGLFNRETPWDRLDGREKARRLVKILYRRKQSGIERLDTLTAKEALGRMQLKADAAEKTADAYDIARYSDHELSSEEMDTLRKELRL